MSHPEFCKGAIIPTKAGQGKLCCGLCRGDRLICVRPQAYDDPTSWVCESCTSTRENRCNLAPAQLAEFHAVKERARLSKFSTDGNRIIKQLADVLAAIVEFIRAHDADCRCDYCAIEPDSAREFVHDLQGLRWVLEVGHSCASCGIVLSRENVPELVELEAKIAAEIEAEAAAEAVIPLPQPATIKFREFL